MSLFQIWNQLAARLGRQVPAALEPGERRRIQRGQQGVEYIGMKADLAQSGRDGLVGFKEAQRMRDRVELIGTGRGLRPECFPQSFAQGPGAGRGLAGPQRDVALFVFGLYGGETLIGGQADQATDLLNGDFGGLAEIGRGARQFVG